MATNGNTKKCSRFCCDICQYKTDKKSSFSNHLLTLKHKTAFNFIKKCSDMFDCNICSKTFNCRSGLWRHKKKCIAQEEITDWKDNNLVQILIKENSEMKSLILEVCKNMQPNNNIITNNSHNKTFNLNVFLNEECKDAMNLTDFVDSLQLQLSDLEKVGELGYVNGLSNIIIRNLKALDINKGPVHCSDAKRETIFIKEADKWEKENEENEKLHKAIKTIANKNIRMIPKWREKHPDCAHSESSKSDQYNNIIIQSLDTNVTSNQKIIRNIAKEVKIDK